MSNVDRAFVGVLVGIILLIGWVAYFQDSGPTWGDHVTNYYVVCDDSGPVTLRTGYQESVTVICP